MTPRGRRGEWRAYARMIAVGAVVLGATAGYALWMRQRDQEWSEPRRAGTFDDPSRVAVQLSDGAHRLFDDDVIVSGGATTVYFGRRAERHGSLRVQVESNLERIYGPDIWDRLGAEERVRLDGPDLLAYRARSGQRVMIRPLRGERGWYTGLVTWVEEPGAPSRVPAPAPRPSGPP